MNKSVEVLFYNDNNDFAVSLNTKEADKIILYRTDTSNSFDGYYNDIQNKKTQYTGNREFLEGDQILIPYVRVNGMISYNELFGKYIKGTEGMYIADVVQDVNFSLNEKGCNLASTATMITEYLSTGDRYFRYNDTFIIYMKEESANKPYFALKVDNCDILEKNEESDEPRIVDHTVVAPEEYPVINEEYKFYEDNNYEYYYKSQKTRIVTVFYKDGGYETVEEALKNGNITMELVDKYGVEYIKKAKRN